MAQLFNTTGSEEIEDVNPAPSVGTTGREESIVQFSKPTRPVETEDADPAPTTGRGEPEDVDPPPLPEKKVVHPPYLTYQRPPKPSKMIAIEPSNPFPDHTNCEVRDAAPIIRYSVSGELECLETPMSPSKAPLLATVMTRLSGFRTPPSSESGSQLGLLKMGQTNLPSAAPMLAYFIVALMLFLRVAAGLSQN